MIADRESSRKYLNGGKSHGKGLRQVLWCRYTQKADCRLFQTREEAGDLGVRHIYAGTAGDDGVA